MSYRVAGAWTLLVISMINTPLSIFTYAKEEPPVVLLLSWFAIMLTCIDIIQTTNVRDENEESKNEEIES